MPILNGSLAATVPGGVQEEGATDPLPSGTYYIPFWGQSNAVGFFEDHGLATTGEADFEERLTTLLNAESVNARNAAFNGSQLTGTVNDGWWNVAGDAPGPQLTNAYSLTSGDGETPVAIVWAQGEADAFDDVSTALYKTTMKKVIAHARSASGFDIPNLPFYIVSLGTYKDGEMEDYASKFAQISRALLEVAQEDDYVFIAASAIDLEPSDNVHYDSNGGYNVLADRLCNFITPDFTDLRPNLPRKGPVLSSASLTNSTTIEATFTLDENSGGFDLAVSTAVEGFEVYKSGVALTITSAVTSGTNTCTITLDSGTTTGDLEVRYGTLHNDSYTSNGTTYTDLIFDDNGFPPEPGFADVV